MDFTVTAENLFMVIGKQHVELEMLRAKVTEQAAEIEKLKPQEKPKKAAKPKKV